MSNGRVVRRKLLTCISLMHNKITQTLDVNSDMEHLISRYSWCNMRKGLISLVLHGISRTVFSYSFSLYELGIYIQKESRNVCRVQLKCEFHSELRGSNSTIHVSPRSLILSFKHMAADLNLCPAYFGNDQAVFPLKVFVVRRY